MIALLPGLLCDEAVWAHQKMALAPYADCYVPLYGARSSITDMAQQVLDEIPSAKFSLAGHSMGGRVALEIVRLASDRVERLVLLDTGVDPLAEGLPGDQERSKRFALLTLATEQGMRKMGAEWARGMVHSSQLNSTLFESILDMIARSTPEVFKAQIAALLARPDARQTLATLDCPTLLMCGRDDAWSPLIRHEAMQQTRPDFELMVVENAGHMVTMEQPAIVSAQFVKWLCNF